MAVLPNLQIDGDLVIDGEVFIPSGTSLSKVVEKIPSTDNAIVRFDGTTGAVQNSGVIIDDNNNVGIGVTPSAWSVKALDIGYGTSISNMGSYVSSAFAANCYYNAGWKYKNNSVASLYEQNGTHTWSMAPSGTAGSAITWTTAMTLDASGILTLNSPTGGLGYGTGAGGTVTQLTNKSTAVTLNKPTGQITMNNAALAVGASVVFAVNNTLITDKDTIIVNINNGANGDKYDLFVWYITSGVCYLRLKNIHSASLSDALVINFTLIKGAVS